MIFAGLALVSPSLARKLRGRAARKFFKNGIVHLKEWKKTGIQAGFTTRHFPLVIHKTDELLQPENQKKLAVSLLPGKNAPPCLHTKFALLNQVHGDSVAVIEDAEKYAKDGFYHFHECDAALTNIPGLTLLVLTADCLSVFLSAGAWVGIVHAGWRGLSVQLPMRAMAALWHAYHSRPEDITVAIGPAIRSCCYEVGREFNDQFGAFVRERAGRLMCDVAGIAVDQLRRSGVRPDRILDCGLCTACDAQHWYSVRREGQATGRMTSFVMLKP